MFVVSDGPVMQVKDGGWLMRQAVGTTPCIIGNKLQTTYHRGAHYLEVTIDINSNATAASITNLVAGSVSSLAIWLGFVLEGKRADHLPERLLGAPTSGILSPLRSTLEFNS